MIKFHIFNPAKGEQIAFLSVRRFMQMYARAGLRLQAIPIRHPSRAAIDHVARLMATRRTHAMQ